MVGSMLAAGVPFLGPAVALWIALIVSVMAFYFLSGAGEHRNRGVQGPPQWRQPTSVEPQPRNEPQGTVSPYDMENYPDTKWGSPT